MFDIRQAETLLYEAAESAFEDGSTVGAEVCFLPDKCAALTFSMTLPDGHNTELIHTIRLTDADAARLGRVLCALAEGRV